MVLNIIYIESIGFLWETEQFYLTALVVGMVIILNRCIYSQEHFLPFAPYLAFEDFIFILIFCLLAVYCSATIWRFLLFIAISVIIES